MNLNMMGYSPDSYTKSTRRVLSIKTPNHLTRNQDIIEVTQTPIKSPKDDKSLKMYLKNRCFDKRSQSVTVGHKKKELIKVNPLNFAIAPFGISIL